ncbi:MAG TPA: PKD domain-containing protein, partial [Planctomycetes bacterium]|nr:PKD domain-containing protein [Planctomycetota bacterium]
RGCGIETGSPSITVGVCDTGILTTHEDLLLHRLEGYNAVDQLWESEGGAIGPIYHHGTRTSGVIAANGDNGVGISGVGWNLSHRMLRVSNLTTGNAFLSTLQHAARTSIENGDRIANVSYAGVNNASNLTTASYIRSLGGLLVWAAGNNGFNYSGSDRDADDLLVVGATDLGDNLASFSNYGAFVDLVAPGVGIYTTNSFASNSYTTADGTSYAAPMVSGICALIWSRRPNLSPDDVQFILKRSAHDLGTPGVDDVFGYGRADLERALSMDATRTPQADFSATPSSGRSPLAVRFRDLSSGVPTSWSWDFGDGANSSAQNPSHTYANSGRYTVTLTVTNELGSASRTIADAVQVDVIAPAADFVATPDSGLSPLTVQFTDTSTGGVPTGWSWDFGDGQTSTVQHPSHTYTASGRYTVSLTASNAYGSTTTSKIDAVIVDLIPPVAGFSIQPTSGASPLVVQFTDLSTGGVPTSWFWNFGDFTTSTAQHPSHTYTAAGTYTVSLTVSNAYGSDTLTMPGAVQILPGPSIVADFTGTPTTGTAPLTVSFTDLSIGNIVQWQWDFGDGGTSSAQNPTHTYTTPGLYNVALQVTDPTGKDAQLERMDYIDVR